MNKTLTILLGVVLGAGLGGTAVYFVAAGGGEAETAQGEREPLYWVAPMDPNYRRDQPGKSPMGMDLVPVYEEAGGAGGGEGVVAISPVVENNLGVRIAPVTIGPLERTINTVGYVRFNEDELVHMNPRIEGWIEELFVKAEGEPVRRGEPVYSIYSPELVNAQEELVLALRRDNPVLIESAQARLDSLLVPRALIDQVRETREVQRRITINAPQDGVVAELNVREGAYVQPGNPVLSIGSLDEVWVMAEIFERQSSLVSEGDPAVMTLDYLPGQKLSGEVDFIYPTLDEDTRTVRVRLRFENPGHTLKPNMFAQVSIQDDDAGEALLVPNEAIISTGRQDRVVLALGDGRYKSVEVLLGRRGEERTEVLEGLEAGDAVVTSAQFLLDSESSISSDFQRMNPETVPETVEMSAVETGQSPDGSADTVRTRGKVEEVMGDRTLSISHEPIPEWQWPQMTMNFEVADDVDIGNLEAGSEVELEITRTEGGGQIITGLTTAGEETAADAVWTRGTIEEVMADGMLSISHEPIPEWQWPQMTMSFEVAPGVDISGLEEGSEIEFEVIRPEAGGQIVTALRPVRQGD